MRTYTAGPRRVLGHEPGSTFTADLDPVQEARLIQSGAIRPGGDASAAPPEPETGSTNLSPEQLEELEGMSFEELKNLAKEIGVEGAEGLKSSKAAIEAIAAHQGGTTEGDTQHG